MPKSHAGWLTIMPSGRWYLHPPKDLSLTDVKGNRLSLRLGPLSVRKNVWLRKAPQEGGKFRTKIRCRMKGEELVIGPLIGILTVGGENGFKGNRDNFRDIVIKGKQLGALVYVFTPEGINFDTGHVRGYLYHEKSDRWKETILPFPHVVYNRVPNRQWERKKEVVEALDAIRALPRTTLFNPRFFNKQELFDTLKQSPAVSRFLPATEHLETLQQLQSFCKQHRFVYLKPATGKAGQGIMRVETDQHMWRVQTVWEQETISHYFPNLQEAWGYIQKQTRDKKYLLQEGVPLAHYRGRPFDVRVLIQKNGKGEWTVTGIGIRRAGPRSITTHVPRGGSIHSSEKVLATVFREKARTITRQIKEAALLIAGILSKREHRLAEMSMDLGVTRDGRIFFFEANAKPEKFDEPKIRQASLRNLIRYSQHASGFR